MSTKLLQNSEPFTAVALGRYWRRGLLAVAPRHRLSGPAKVASVAALAALTDHRRP